MIQPLATRPVIVPDAGVDFTVHVLEGSDRKAEAGREQRASGIDPFLPYDPALFVADLPPDHVCLLNKFPAIERHLLVVTREFVPQHGALTPADMDALWRCMAAIDGLAFYNSGPVAGASQPHRHLQLVPAPVGRAAGRTPIDPLLRAAGARPGTVPGLGFPHRAVRLALEGEPAATDAAAALLDACRALHAAMDLPDEREWNLLATRSWMLLVPRTRAAWHGIPVNALGFAGSLLARDTAGLERLRAAGPMAVLAAVAAAP